LSLPLLLSLPVTLPLPLLVSLPMALPLPFPAPVACPWFWPNQALLLLLLPPCAQVAATARFAFFCAAVFLRWRAFFESGAFESCDRSNRLHVLCAHTMCNMVRKINWLRDCKNRYGSSVCYVLLVIVWGDMKNPWRSNVPGLLGLIKKYGWNLTNKFWL
jgi:hypothetical protein